MSRSKKVNKRIGGQDRALEARKELEKVFEDKKHPMYFAKDIEYARKFDVSRHTIYRIRDELKIVPRSERIIEHLKTLSLSKYTIRDLQKILNVKYQNLYKLLEESGLRDKVKPDIQPIEHLKKYQKDRKASRLGK